MRICILQSKRERIIGFFTCLALGLICFGLVCGTYFLSCDANVSAGIGSDSSDCCEIKKVCCTVYNGQSLQYEQV